MFELVPALPASLIAIVVMGFIVYSGVKHTSKSGKGGGNSKNSGGDGGTTE